jgi:vanillate O-demethylase monooxygenase subunit
MADAPGFLKNTWYAAAPADEVSRTMLRRVILGEPIVFYRKEDGTPTALLDRCAHRFAPLSRGRLDGDNVQCGYHGLVFGSTGQCVHNPHADSIPPRASVRAFPVLECYGFIWIWPGEPEAADPALLPDLSPYGREKGYHMQYGKLVIDANYQLVVDNLLDLSHVEFLHPAFTSQGALGNTRHEVFEENGVVHSNRFKSGVTISPLLTRCWGKEKATGDARSCIRWHPAGTLFLEIGATEAGASTESGVTVWFLHLVTPETQERSHYFWAALRDRHIDDEDLSASIRRISEDAFLNEDEPMLEAQQANLFGRDISTMAPVYLDPDKAPLRARRVLQQRMSAEAATLASEGSSGTTRPLERAATAKNTAIEHSA